MDCSWKGELVPRFRTITLDSTGLLYENRMLEYTYIASLYEAMLLSTSFNDSQIRNTFFNRSDLHEVSCRIHSAHPRYLPGLDSMLT